MDISPDGHYLYTLSTSAISGVVLSQYQIDTTTGLPTVDTPTTLLTAGTSCSILQSNVPLSQECTVKVSPNGNYVALALGGYGFQVYPYTSTGGVSNTSQLSPSPSLTSADFSLAFDTNNYLYVSSTTALTSFGGLGGTAAPVQEQSVAYAAGVTPRSVTVASGAGYVYTANEGNSTISGYSLPGSGVMTSLGSAIVGPTDVSALGVDSTGKYLVAAGFSVTNGLQIFNITSSGTLTATGSTEGTGSVTTVPTVMALSH
jgi:6-phosphogluconolactonase (cycloisomerase 2 family)